MKKQRVFMASAFATLLILCLSPGMARANVSVDCNAGGSINAALATLTPTGPNQITVTGTCSEDVTITDIRSLTIMSGVDGAKIVQSKDSNTFDIVRAQNITLQNREIVGVPGSTFGSGGFGVSIFEPSDVHILGCDVHDNKGGGVIASTSSVLILQNTNIHNNTPGDGLDVFRNSIATVIATTIQNNGCFWSGDLLQLRLWRRRWHRCRDPIVRLSSPEHFNSEQWRHRNTCTEPEWGGLELQSS